MKVRSVGIFEYADRMSDKKQAKLPGILKLETATNEALLVRLLLGQLDLKKCSGKLVNQRVNYMKLPLATVTRNDALRDIGIVFSNGSNGIDVVRNAIEVDGYFKRNRKNHSVHEKVLFELSCYLANKDTSPTTAFAHLYRCLEYMAYSFPMLYAAKSKNYKGTFSDLKKFFSGDSDGELKFFKKFLNTLFEDEKSTLKYEFEIVVRLSAPVGSLERDFKSIYRKFPYSFENSIIRIKFEDLLDFFITTRNRFFHMLVGQGQDNFESIDYDICEYFSSINPCIINWLSVIIQKICAFGFYSSLSDS